jgi:hypothetical protein
VLLVALISSVGCGNRSQRATTTATAEQITVAEAAAARTAQLEKALAEMDRMRKGFDTPFEGGETGT